MHQSHLMMMFISGSLSKSVFGRAYTLWLCHKVYPASCQLLSNPCKLCIAILRRQLFSARLPARSSHIGLTQTYTKPGLSPRKEIPLNSSILNDTIVTIATDIQYLPHMGLEYISFCTRQSLVNRKTRLRSPTAAATAAAASPSLF